MNLEAQTNFANEAAGRPLDHDESSAGSSMGADVEHIDVEACDAFQGPRVLRLSADCIKESRWANRHPTAYSSAEYTALVEAIKLSGSNIQPIKVRKVNPSTGQHTYEVVFGHRRLRVCRELGIPVRAIVADQMSDKQMYLEMQSENSHRHDLSPWEQGESFRRALDSGLYSSARELAEATGVTPGLVSKGLAIARLPPDVLAAFDQLSDIQYRFSALLNKALTSDQNRVLARARSLARDEISRTGKEVCDQLLGLVPDSEDSEEIKVESRIVAIVKTKGAKGETIEFSQPLGEHRKQKVISAIQAVFSDAVPQTEVIGWIAAPGRGVPLSECQN